MTASFMSYLRPSPGPSPRPVPGRGSRTPGLEDGDERERREGQEPVDPPEDGREQVEQPDLEEAEAPPPQELPVEPPGRRPHPVEAEQLLHLEAGLRGERTERLLAVAAPVAQHLVERAEEAWGVRHEHERAAAGGEDRPDVLQRAGVLLHVL